ncbi:tetratricopeptide repeat protein [Candidatus Omnitrophota bacterium]
METNRLHIIVASLLIAALGLLVYANSLNNAFIWDDDNLIKDNVIIRSISNARLLFSNGTRKTVGARSSCSFRPMQMLTYMIDYSFWGLNVIGYHLTSTIIHILVAISLFWLVNILFSNKLLAFLTSILFVSHPIHTEAITYIAGRADPLSALFIVLSFIFYVKYDRSRVGAFLVIAIISFIAALLSRENSIIFPILILIYHYSFKEKIKAAGYSPFVILSAVYILIRATILRNLLPHLTSENTLLQRIPGVFAALSGYLRVLLVPIGLHMEYQDKIFKFFDPQVLSGIAIFIFLIIWVLKKGGKSKLALFSFLFFFIALLPSMNLYPIRAYMAEHWLYLPSIGFFLVIANAGYRLSVYGVRRAHLREPQTEHRTPNLYVLAAMALLITFYSVRTIQQNTYWKDPLTFYQTTLKYAPDSGRIHNNIGFEYYNRGEKERAIPFIKKAIELDPKNAKAYYNLGNAYYERGENSKAIALLKKAIEIESTYSAAYNNLGIIYSVTGRRSEAVQLYLKAIEINPYYAFAYNNLGNTYSELGRYQDASNSYLKAIELDNNYAIAHMHLAIAYFHLKKYQDALRECDRAIDLGARSDPEFLQLLKFHRNN